MEEQVKNIHYDWKYEALRNFLKFAKWAMIILFILYVLYVLLGYAPIWLLSMVIGAVLFAIPSYIFIKTFFKVNYLIFLHVDLEKRLTTPFFVPRKLIVDGEWELDGVKTRYKSIECVIDDEEINRIFRECEKIAKKIEDLEEKKIHLEALKHIILKELPYKKTYKRWKLYNLFGFNIIAKYPILEKFPVLVLKKNNHKRYSEIILELNKIKNRVRELKAEKNNLLMQLEWTGIEGGEIYFIDEINKKAKKIQLSPLHQTSDLELQLNKHKFSELKTKLSSMIKEYARLKINYDDNVLLKAVELVEDIDNDESVRNLEGENGQP